MGFEDAGSGERVGGDDGWEVATGRRVVRLLLGKGVRWGRSVVGERNAGCMVKWDLVEWRDMAKNWVSNGCVSNLRRFERVLG